jgi:hypothetical protein
MMTKDSDFDFTCTTPSLPDRLTPPPPSAPLILCIPRFDLVDENEQTPTFKLRSAYEPDLPKITNDLKYTPDVYVPNFEEDPERLKAVTNKQLIDKGWVEEKTLYEILPKMTDNEGAWPIATTVHCWWCTFPFDTRPIPIARHCSTKRFKLQGNFCSFNCAKSYIHDSRSSSQMLANTCYVFSRMSGVKISSLANVCAAPPREMLKIFGGPYTIKEFRDASIQLKEYKKYPFNCITVNEHIEESIRMNVQLAEVESDSESEHMKLPKRKRPSKDEGIMIKNDAELRTRMVEAKERLGAIKTTQKPKKVRTRSTATSKKGSSESENQTVNDVISAAPCETANTSDGAVQSEYTIGKMMGLKIIRRQKNKNTI